MIDVTSFINTTERKLGTRTLAEGEARVAEVSRLYPASVDEVWDACTSKERIPRWFLPVSGDLEVGGRYQLEGNAEGVVESCDPPRAFTATWEFADQISWIEVNVDPEGDQTRFTLRHIAVVDDEYWPRYGPGAAGVGWDLALLGLTLHLESGEPVDADAVLGWQESEEGLKLVTSSSEAWAEANIAAGEDPEQARKAAARTTAFYTGQPEPE